ncbi:MAG TPA: DUF3576 domain-containing protein [Candidatus Cybelea sp.]|nr:DUF3576 domain-containing protein [Candidatus Cybelea sp.]
MKQKKRKLKECLAPVALLATLALSACDSIPVEGTYPDDPQGTGYYDPEGTKKKKDSVFGDGGLQLFGRDDKDAVAAGQGGSGIGVNSFLWRASLDTLGFMPLASADPFGGVIITDWYSPPATPDERFKATVYILDRRLRADGIKVAIFKQAKGTAGDWADQAVTPDTATKLEDAILTRARQLRIDAAAK